nr:unnamed protein product [Spirometra erinaceieuropaei]
MIGLLRGDHIDHKAHVVTWSSSNRIDRNVRMNGELDAKVTHRKAKNDLTSSQLDEAKLELSALDRELCDANDVIESYKEEILKLESENERLLEVSQEVQNACETLQSQRKTLEGRITHFGMGLLAAAVDANVKVEADMQELEQKFAAEMLRVNSRMVELSQLKAICDEEIEQRKALEVELQEQKKDVELLGTQVQTKETQLHERSRASTDNLRLV